MRRSAKFWQFVCDAKQYFLMMYAALFVLLFLTVFSIVLGTPGTQAYRLSFVNLGLIGFALAINTAVVWKCERR